MALYGIDFYGASRYGPRIYLDFDASPMRAISRGYGQLEVTWSSPGGNWSILRLVRSAYGVPISAEDGAILISSNSGPAATGTVSSPVNAYVDRDLVGGRFYYYAVWLYVPAIDEWTRAAYTTGLAVQDYGYSNRLWELTPSVFRTQTTSLLDNDNETLRSYYRIHGFQLDHIRAEYETLRHVNDPYKVSGNLLPLMAKQWGQFFEPELGMGQMRKLLAATVYLYRNKGTVPGIEGFVKAVSGYGANVLPLKNLMLDYNDSSFEESIGRWVARTNCTLTRYVADGVIAAAGEFYEGQRQVGLLKMAATAAGDMGADLTGTGDLRLIGMPVQAGVVYTASAYARADAVARGTHLQVHWYTAAGVYISTTNGAGSPITNTVGSWARVTLSATAPSTAVYATLSLYVLAVAAGEVHYFDALQFEEGSVATDFTDARLIDIQALAPRVNLSTNPSFESSLVGWTGAAYRNLLTANQSSLETDTAGWSTNSGGVSLARSTAQSLNGTASLAVTATAAGSPSIRTLQGTSGVPVVAGQVYTIVASLRAGSTPRTIQVWTRWWDAAGVVVGYGPTGTVGDHTKGWQQVTTTAQAPANAAFGEIGMTFLNCAAGEVHYVDGIGLYADPQGNLVSNPDFESGLTGWTLNGTGMTAAQSTEQAYTGRSSAKITAGSGGVARIYAPPVGVTSGVTYTASAWIKAVAGRRIEVFLYDAASVSIRTTTVATGDWQRLVATGTATASDSSVALYVGYTTNSVTDSSTTTLAVAGDVAYVDGAMVTATSSAVEYVPPTTHNLVRNSSFENGTTAWSTAGGTAVTTEPFIGANSGMIPAGPYVYFVQSPGFQPNTTYTVSFFMRVDAPYSGTGCGLVCEGLSLSSGWHKAQTTTPSTTWTKYSTTFTTSATHTPGSGNVNFHNNYGGSSSGGNVYFDAIQVELGSVATPYVDGSTGPAAKWNASENLIANSSFETDTAGWEGLNKNLLTAQQSSIETDTSGWSTDGTATLARDIVVFFAGAASMSMTKATAAGTMYLYNPNDLVNIVPGQVYTAVAHVRAGSTARQAEISMAWRLANGNVITSVAAPRVGDNSAGWQQLRLTAQAPADAVKASVSISFYDVALNEVHYVDAVGLFETPNGNLVPNPDFESGVVGWLANATTQTALTEQAYTGRQSVKLVQSTTDADAYTASAVLPARAGVTYTVSAWVNVTVFNGQAALSRGLAMYDYGNAATFTSDNITATTPGWVRKTVTVTPTTSSGLAIRLYSPNGTVYWDAVQLVVGSSAPEYLPPTTHNLLVDPSATLIQNANPGGWVSNWAGQTIVTDKSYIGGQSVRTGTYQPGTGVASTGNTDAGTPAFAVVPGQTYTASAYISSSQTRSTSAVIYWYGPTHTTNGSDYISGSNAGPAVTSTASGWVRQTVTAVAPAGAAYGRAFFGVMNMGATDYLWVDAAQVEQGSVATPYVDGSLGAGYAWDASENLLSAAASSFEDATVGGWNNNANATLANSTVQAFSGTASLSYAATAAGASSIYSPVVTVVAGTTLTVSAYFRADATGRAIQLQLYEYDSSGAGTPLATVNGTDVTTGWTRLTRTATTSATAVTVRVIARVTDTAQAVGEVHYLDAVQVEQRSYATPYAQAGTAHASTSTRRQPWVLGGTWFDPIAQYSDSYVGTKSLIHYWNNQGLWWPKANIPAGVETRVNVAPNTTYTYSQFTKYGGSAVLRILDAATGAVLGTGAAASNTSSWVRHIHTFTTGSATTQVRVQSLIGTNDIYIDAVQLEQKPYATAFESAATAHASTSTRQSPWTLGGQGATTLTRETGTSTTYSGVTVLRVDHVDGVGSGAVHDVTLEPYTTYTVSAWTKTPGGEPPAVIQVSSGGVVVATGNAASGTAEVWERIHLTFTTTGATLYNIGILANTATNVSHNFWVDAVLIEKGAALFPFFDGTSYAFTGESMWEGTPNESRSHLYPQRKTKNYRMNALLKDYTPMGSSYRLRYALT